MGAISFCCPSLDAVCCDALSSAVCCFRLDTILAALLTGGDVSYWFSFSGKCTTIIVIISFNRSALLSCNCTTCSNEVNWVFSNYAITTAVSREINCRKFCGWFLVATNWRISPKSGKMYSILCKSNQNKLKGYRTIVPNNNTVARENALVQWLQLHFVRERVSNLPPTTTGTRTLMTNKTTALGN